MMKIVILVALISCAVHGFKLSLASNRRHTLKHATLKDQTVSEETLLKDPSEPKNTWKKVALTEPTEVVESWDFQSKNLQSTDGVKDSMERLNAFAKLQGTYYINGLGSCAVGSRLVHPFEAHGFMKSLELHGNATATFRSKFIETPCTSIERSLKTPLFRGVMSRPFAPPFTFLNAVSPQERNTANLACRVWPPTGTITTDSPQLIVSGDNGAPYVLNPRTLQTEGRLAEVNRDFRNLDGIKLLAHTRYDSLRKRLVMSACKFELDKPGEPGKVLLQFWEYDDEGKLVTQRDYRTDFMVVHDWMITDNYYVVPKNPAEMDWPNLVDFIVGKKRGVDVFKMDSKTLGSILLIPRHDPLAKVLEVTADTFFTIFHFGPVFERYSDGSDVRAEEKDGEVIIHAVVFDKYQFGNEMGFDVDQQEFDPTKWSTSKDVAPPRLDRFVIDTATGTMKSRGRIPLIDAQTGDDVPVDMPTFHPLRDGRACRYTYFTGGGKDGWFPFRSLVKADLVTGVATVWNAGVGKVVSEPMFIPSKISTGDGDEEDDGFIISVISNSKDERCELAVFDAKDFSSGPLALFDLGFLAPWSIHGHWVPLKT